MAETLLEEFVVDVFAVGGEDGAAADEAGNHRERGFKNRQSKRNDGDGNGDDGRSFLCAFQSQRAQQETDEETAGISEKDGGWVEVIAKKAEDCASQRNGHHGNQSWPVEQGNHERN